MAGFRAGSPAHYERLAGRRSAGLGRLAGKWAVWPIDSASAPSQDLKAVRWGRAVAPRREPTSSCGIS